jgi:peptide/nickel transport system permease protein
MEPYKQNDRAVRARGALAAKVLSSSLLLLLIGASYVRIDLIAASFVSLVLSALSLLLNPDSSATLQLGGLLEYWIAALAWLTAFGILLFGIVRTRAEQLAVQGEAVARIFSYVQERARLMGVGLRAILFFVFVAATAPFLAPWDPAAQGTLPGTRLLPPLSLVSYVEFVPTLKATTGGAFAARLAEVNNYLLNRSIKFSAIQGHASLTVPSADGARIVKRGESVLFLGSDHLGRDLLSRIMYGTRISLGIALLAALSAVAVGTGVGVVAGIAGGITERLLMRLLDVLLAIPSLFFILAVMAFLGTNVLVMTSVLIALGWMTPARIVRTEVASLREKEFILSARLFGVSTPRMILAHILPNMLPVLLTSFLLLFSNMVLAEATLSFLGLGVQPPTPSWGNIIGEATSYLRIAWWIGVFPGIALSCLILAAHVAVKGWEEDYGS